MSNLLDSLFVALGFEVDTENLDKFHNKVDDLRNTALKIGAMFTGAAVGIGLMVKEAAEGMGTVAHFAELNQISARSAAAWNQAALESEVSNESAMQSLQSLNQKLGEAAIGLGRGRMIFQRLGLSAKDSSGKVKSLDEILGEVADKMSHMSRAGQIAMAERLGIDPKFVMLLEKGSANLARVREEAAKMVPFSDKDFEMAEEINIAFLKAKATVGIFTKMFAVQFFPAVKRALDMYVKWFYTIARSEKVKDTLKKIADVVGNLTQYFFSMAGVTVSAIERLSQMEGVLTGVGIALGVILAYKTGVFFRELATAVMDAAKSFMALDAAAAPEAILIGAIALAIGLIVEDLYNWSKGNQSLFGELTKRFPWLLTTLQVVQAASLMVAQLFMAAWAELKEPVMELLSSIWDLIKVLAPVLWPIIKMIFGTVGITLLFQFITAIKMLGVVLKFVSFVVEGIAGSLKFIVDMATSAISKVSTLASKIKIPGLSDMLSTNLSAALSLMPSVQGMQPAFAGAPTAASGVLGRSDNGGRASGMVSMHQNTFTGNQITVISPDPNKAGQNIQEHFERQSREATRNGQSGVTI